MFDRFLVPLDGSSLAEAVLPLVESLAMTCGASVLLLHVLERDAPSAIHGDRHLRSAEEASRYLDALAARLRVHGIVVETHAHDAPEGDVARSIVMHCSETMADLIVLCTHGRGTVRTLLFGRIAQQVLRRGAVPVLMLRPPDADSIPDGIDALGPIVVPLDGTPLSEAALAPAARMAQRLGVTLHLVMIVATLETMTGDRQAVAALLPASARAMLELERADARLYLDGLSQRVRSEWAVAVTYDVHRGDVPTTLAQEAVTHHAQMIVISTHGRAGLQAVWASSVAARLLARTRVPTMLLRIIEE